MSPYLAAADKLRETSKWLFTGIVVTAGGIFAGGSLTSMGSLTLEWRLALLGLGLSIGFLGLSLLAAAAIRVLTINLGTAQMIADEAEFAQVRVTLNKMFKTWPSPAAEPRPKTFRSFVKLIDVQFNLEPDLRDKAFMSDASVMLREVTAVASFLRVRGEFDRLVRHMWWQVLLMAVGFGLFAWSANPPDKPAPPERGIEFKITY